MRRFIAGILMIVSIILLTISIYFLMGMFIQERQDNQLQQELQELMQEKEDEPGENSSGDSFIEVDAGILALHEENPDCIGWLTIEGTKIDYPVMYRPGDKNYYLHRDFNGDYSACLLYTSVFALEDVKSADGESEDYYKKDELVATITTDDTGIAKLSGLPLGKYYVKEKATVDGLSLIHI